MAFTDDNWKTVRTALGEHNYKHYNGNKIEEVTGYGLSSDFVVSGTVSGSQIIGGEIYSSNYVPNSKGTYFDLMDGYFQLAGGSIVYKPSDNPNEDSKLELKNVEAIHGRAEETAKTEGFRESYDVVVSRAVARLNILMEITIPFVKVNGTCLYMKADKTNEELAEANKAIKELGVKHIDTEQYNLVTNNETFTHTIIKLSKQESTKSKYPRQFSKIKKSPL
jgi:hypothetical protein